MRLTRTSRVNLGLTKPGNEPVLMVDEQHIEPGEVIVTTADDLAYALAAFSLATVIAAGGPLIDAKPPVRPGLN
jgi:hypothetical protein